MSLLKKSKRFEVNNLFVCKVFVADNLQHKYLMIGGDYVSLWTPHLLGIKILYGNGKTLKDPIYDTEYVAEVDSLHPDKNLYYQKLGNIADIFDSITIGKKAKISLTKIQELNSLIKETYENITK